MLLHLVDGTEQDPGAAYRTVRAELAAYGEGLVEKPEIVCLSKCDALDARRRARRLKSLAAAASAPAAPISSVPVAAISSASGEGVREVLRGLWRAVAAKRQAAARDGDGAAVEKRVWDPMVGLR